MVIFYKYYMKFLIYEVNNFNSQNFNRQWVTLFNRMIINRCQISHRPRLDNLLLRKSLTNRLSMSCFLMMMRNFMSVQDRKFISWDLYYLSLTTTVFFINWLLRLLKLWKLNGRIKQWLGPIKSSISTIKLSNDLRFIQTLKTTFQNNNIK